jgi:hypothetical protein
MSPTMDLLPGVESSRVKMMGTCVFSYSDEFLADLYCSRDSKSEKPKRQKKQPHEDFLPEGKTDKEKKGGRKGRASSRT